jgi:hypothetical protein
MLSTEQVNDLHRLYWSEHWPIRKIERHLRMGWHTIRKYLDAPAQGPAKRSRRSQLDPFKSTIAEWLQEDSKVSGTVIERRLRPLGYRGGHTILRDYLTRARSQIKQNRAFVRMEPALGERFEVDGGHFGALDYCGDKRKLYAFAMVEAHSRMLYLEFTHSQSFETFLRCHIHAFVALGGVAREISSCRRGQTFGAGRFEAELADLRPAARRSRAQQRLFLFLDGLCSQTLLEAYLRDLADTDRTLSRQLTEHLELIRQYGPEAVATAIEKASAARAFGADYVANILRQQQAPRRPQPPLILRDPLLNELATDPLSLLGYDAFILHPGKESDDNLSNKN